MNILDKLKSDKLDCCGAGICSAVCPCEAIETRLNNEGFFFPFIDNEKCIDCGLCTDIGYCHLNENELIDYNTCKKYFAYAKDPESAMKSASGGIAFEMYKYALNNGYKVIGTEYDIKSQKAVTSISSTVSGIEKFRTSKYLHAYSADAFRQAIHSTDKYLIIGTPCQIYELKSYANSSNQLERFVFVDFVCHGVPSYKVWDKYLRCEMQDNHMESLESINFRNKKYGWHNISIELKSERKTVIHQRADDFFFRTFDDAYLMNKPCYQCKINNGRGVSDIRIGDYWGKEFEDNQVGVSKVTIGTPKGKDFFDQVRVLVEYGETPQLTYPHDNRNFMKNVYYPKLRIVAFRELDNDKHIKHLAYVVFWHLPIKYKIVKIIDILPKPVGAVIYKIIRLFKHTLITE